MGLVETGHGLDYARPEPFLPLAANQRAWPGTAVLVNYQILQDLQ